MAARRSLFIRDSRFESRESFAALSLRLFRSGSGEILCCLRTESRLFVRWACASLIFVVLAACQPVPHQLGPGSTQTARPTTLLARTAAASPSPSTRPSRTPTSAILNQASLGDLKGIHVQFWYPFLGKTADQFAALAARFNQENTWGIWVDGRALGNPSELSRQVEAALPGSSSPGAGELPDLVIANPEQALRWQVLSPVLVDLTGYLSDPAVGLSAQERGDFALPFWNLGLSDGKQVGLPALGSVQVLFYNQTWAKELGFNQPPATTEEFRQQACKAALANRQDGSIENDGTGGWLISSDGMTMLEWLAAFGASIDPAPGQAYTFNTPQAAAAFTFLKDLVSHNCAWLGLDPQPYTYFATRRALFYSGSLEDIPAQEAASAQQASKDAWTVIPMPGSAGQPVVITFGQTYHLVASTPARQLAAWLFLRWMVAPDVQAQLVRVTGAYPLRGAELTLLADYRHDHPQWGAVWPFASFAHIPPVQASWVQVSSVLEDASQQLFQPETTPDQIPAMLAEMDAMALELSRVAP
jgi:multiple sugar transport system substrate-binding protein